MRTLLTVIIANLPVAFVIEWLTGWDAFVAHLYLVPLSIAAAAAFGLWALVVVALAGGFRA